MALCWYPTSLNTSYSKMPSGGAASCVSPSFTATGVLGFEFGGYELFPTDLTVDPAPLPVPVRLREAGEFTLGTLNLFRLFDDFDDPSSTNAQGDVRDDFVASTAEYCRRRDKFAAYILDVLDAPDVLSVQEAEKIEVLQDLAADIYALDSAVVYTAFLEEGNGADHDLLKGWHLFAHGYELIAFLFLHIPFFR